MNVSSIARAGGDRVGDARKMSSRGSVDTAGAPATGERRLGNNFASRVFQIARPPADAPRGDARPEPVATPEWIEILPASPFHGRDGRGPYRVDAPEAVIEATRKLGLSAGLPVDYDHATDFAAPRGAPAPAAGWVRELEVRRGAIWGRVEWTARAADAIHAGEYRYLSPVFQYSVCDGQVTRLLRAGLTNNPNLYLSAISAAGGEGYNMDEFLNQLKALLGLDPDTTAAEVLAAVEDLLTAEKTRGAEDPGEGDQPPAPAANATMPDPARYVAVSEYKKLLGELNLLRAERASEAAEHAVDEAIRAGKLTPAQRQWAVSYCAADPAGFGAFAARQPAVLKGELPLGDNPRAAARSGPMTLSRVETAVCAQLGVPAADYLKRRQAGADFLRLDREHGGQAF